MSRALIADPKILILDEPTSSVDVYSEKIIIKALEYLMMNRTTIIITHRISTIKKADRILIIGNGGVQEEVTYSELLSRSEEFINLPQKILL